MKRRWILLVAFFCLCGCSTRALVIREMTGMVQSGMGAMESETDLALARDAMPGNIKLLETMLVNDPANHRLRMLLARMYASYAFLFIETDVDAARYETATDADPDALAGRATEFYGRAEAYALEVLQSQHPEFGSRIGQIHTAEALLGEMDTSDAPALFWYGFALGARINLNRDDVGLLVRAPIAAAVMHRVIQVAPTYFHGSAHLALMLYYGGRSAAMGGRPDLADKHYRELKAVAGDDYLMADVLYARHVLVNRADRDGFHRLLSVSMAVTDERPEYGLMNSVARRRATIYMAAIDDFFI